MPPFLREIDMAPDPIAQFRRWWEQVLAAGLHQPEAMTLATATPAGEPSARMVLLRGIEDRGFVFFTNYESRKGQELAVNPRAALVLHWPEQDRQVRIEGDVEQVSPAESEAYFQGRPRGSQLGDMTLSPAGNLLVCDSNNGGLYLVRPGDSRLARRTVGPCWRSGSMPDAASFGPRRWL